MRIKFIVNLVIILSVLLFMGNITFAKEFAFKIILENPVNDSTFNKMFNQTKAALEELNFIKNVETHNMNKSKIAKRTAIFELSIPELDNLIVEAGGDYSLFLPYSIAIAEYNGKLVLTMLNPKVLVWTFLNDVPNDLRAKINNTFEKIYTRIKNKLQNSVNGTKVDKGCGPSYLKSDLEMIKKKDFIKVVYTKKSPHPDRDFNKVLNLAIAGVWAMPKWNVPKVYRINKSTVTFGICNKHFAKIAMSMGTYHAAILPCSAAVWIEKNVIKVGMIKPSFIFHIFFGDVSKGKFIKYATLPQTVQDEIHTALTKKLPTKKGTIGKPKFFAYSQLHFVSDQTEGHNDYFKMFRVRLGAKGKVASYISYHLMGEFGGGESAKLLQAWIGYHLSNLFNFKIGQFKTTFAKEYMPPALKWDFITVSEVIHKIAGKLGREGKAFRDIGLMMYGKTGNSKFGFNYDLFIFQGNGINTLDNNEAKDLVAHIDFNILKHFTLGGSYYKGTFTTSTDSDSVDLDENAFGLNLTLKFKSFKLEGEYISADYENYNADSTTPEGYYAKIMYRFLPWLELGLRYDEFKPNTNVDNPIKMTKTTIGVNFWLYKLNRISINYEIRNDDSNPELKNQLLIQFQAAI